MADARPPSPINLDVRSTIATLLCDQPIAYHPLVARAVGSVTAGVLLSQFLYWTPRSRDGWIWKTQPEIQAETALTRWEQETARKTLRTLGVLSEQRRGNPGRLYYRVNIAALERAVIELQDAGFPQSSMRQSRNQECGIATIKHAAIPHTLHLTEITTETTPETTNSNGSPEPSDDGSLESSATPLTDAAIADASRALGNLSRLTSNLTRARNLITQHHLSDEAFATLIPQAVTETTQRTGLKNRAAYCFAVLASLAESYQPPAVRGDKSLAGRYAHLIHNREDDPE